MQRDGRGIARCSVERLMRYLGLAGVILGKPVRTMISDKATPCPGSRQPPVPRTGTQPTVSLGLHPRPCGGRLYVLTLTLAGARLWAVPPAMPPTALYVASVIDVFACYIVRWRGNRTAHASFVLDALEQALHDRRPVHRRGLIHHSDRKIQYVSIKYTERLAQAGIEPSVGSGDSLTKLWQRRSTVFKGLR